MAIKIGGKTVNLEDLQPVPVVNPQPVVEQPVVRQTITETPKRVVFKSDQPKIKDGNTLIVNGKKKTIGRKSQYLLDMMIIDED